MKKILIITAGILITIGMYAQPPGGGSFGGRGPGGPPPGGEMPNYFSPPEDKIILEHFPEIPNLALKQREKVGDILFSEHKDIEKQIEKKHKIERSIHPNLSSKDMEKKRENIRKIDNKIQNIRDKSNNKVKKELSEDQYLVFLEKRKEFKFRRQPQQKKMFPGNSGNNNEQPPFPPQSDDFF